jgi:hypothetical protein
MPDDSFVHNVVSVYQNIPESCDALIFGNPFNYFFVNLPYSVEGLTDDRTILSMALCVTRLS